MHCKSLWIKASDKSKCKEDILSVIVLFCYVIITILVFCYNNIILSTQLLHYYIVKTKYLYTFQKLENVKCI